MRSELDLERALAAAGLRAPVRWEEVTGSTNATAYALAMDGAPEWTLVAAGHQTAGRGRLGRILGGRRGTGPALLDRAPAVGAARGCGAPDPAGGRRLGGDGARGRRRGRHREVAERPARRRREGGRRAGREPGGRGAARRRDPRLRDQPRAAAARRPGRRARRRRGSGGPARGVPRAVPGGLRGRAGTACRTRCGRVGGRSPPRSAATWRRRGPTGSRSAGAPWTSTPAAASCSTRVTGSRWWPSARSCI